MNITEQEKQTLPSAADCAEAAAWIAKLHGEDRGPQLDAGFRRWLAASPAHRTAFEMANELWTETTRIPQADYPVRLAPERPLLTAPRMAVVAAVMAAIAFSTILWLPRDPSIGTDVGEFRNVVLEDGTRVVLNTATRITVRYDEETRTVELNEGEALFDVAKRSDRPFIVTASGQRIKALGTSFLVRRESNQVAVTLLSGKVAVSSLRPALLAGRARSDTPAATLFTSGERLTFSSRSSKPKLDRPALEQVMAWQRGQVILDHTSLSDAVSEMNRYSVKQLAIESAQTRNVQVTGVFRAGDSEEFARAVADSYGLLLSERSGTLVLSDTPARN